MCCLLLAAAARRHRSVVSQNPFIHADDERIIHARIVGCCRRYSAKISFLFLSFSLFFFRAQLMFISVSCYVCFYIWNETAFWLHEWKLRLRGFVLFGLIVFSFLIAICFCTISELQADEFHVFSMFC